MTEEDVLDALRHVEEREIGMNIVDLGLVYGVEVIGDTVRVALADGCPTGPAIEREVAEALRERLPGAREVIVSFVAQPPWTPDCMSAQAKRQLRGR